MEIILLETALISDTVFICPNTKRLMYVCDREVQNISCKLITTSVVQGPPKNVRSEVRG